eukprot:893907-Pyramimonas_sp.AAC.1
MTGGTQVLVRPDRSLRGERGRRGEEEVVRCAWCQEAVRPLMEDHCVYSHRTFDRRTISNTEFEEHKHQVRARPRAPRNLLKTRAY